MSRTSFLIAALVVGLLMAVSVSPAAIAHHTVIQPGSYVSTTRGGCTLNFVFDGTGSLSGRTFIGTGAHCVRVAGENARVGDHTLKVFYVGDVPGAINGDGRGDNGYPGHQMDFALIEVTGKPVSPEVRGHANSPDGYTMSSDTRTGDRVLFSGYGLGFGLTKTTREDRQGILQWDNARTYTIHGPIISGDSGGPILHQSGAAFGIVSTISATGARGPTVQGVIDELAGLGIGIELRSA